MAGQGGNRRLERAKGPGAVLLLLAMVSLILPLAGIALGIWGGVSVLLGDPFGWRLVLAGAACIILDILIDYGFALPSLRFTDEPTLNRRSAELIGRIAVVCEAICDGRGKVRIGDSIWMAEGPDLPPGMEVRVVDARDVVLIVAPA